MSNGLTGDLEQAKIGVCLATAHVACRAEYLADDRPGADLSWRQGNLQEPRAEHQQRDTAGKQSQRAMTIRGHADLPSLARQLFPFYFVAAKARKRSRVDDELCGKERKFTDCNSCAAKNIANGAQLRSCKISAKSP
jgi:hypothetical protein